MADQERYNKILSVLRKVNPTVEPAFPIQVCMRFSVEGFDGLTSNLPSMPCTLTCDANKLVQFKGLPLDINTFINTYFLDYPLDSNKFCVIRKLKFKKSDQIKAVDQETRIATEFARLVDCVTAERWPRKRSVAAPRGLGRSGRRSTTHVNPA